MHSIRLMREAVRSLARQRFRSAMMLLATTLGVAALVIITAFGRGTQQEVLDTFAKMFAGNTMFVRAGGAEFGPSHRGAMPQLTLTIADLEAIRAALPAVTMYDPMLATRRDVVTDAGTSREVTIEGHGADAEALWARPAARGAHFTSEDVASSARVALIGSVAARELFGRRDPVGESIRIGNVPFEIIGVIGDGGMDPHGVDRDDAIWIPITTLQRRVLNVDYIGTAKLGFAPGTDLDLITLDVSDVLRRVHKLQPGTPNDFALYTPVAVQERIQETNRTFTVFLPLASAFAIIVGAFVVANLMLLTVSDRRAEIGLRKAVGAKPSDIRTQFLLEATLITTAGGALAVAIGYLALEGAARLGWTTVPLPWPVAALGAVIATAVGIVAGLMPARRAAGLDPVQALR